jgi:hypothetical protein
MGHISFDAFGKPAGGRGGGDLIFSAMLQQDRHFESDFEKEVKRISGKNDRKPEGGDV